MNMMGSILWKIGSSVVITVPSSVVKEFGIVGKDKRIFSVNITFPCNGDNNKKFDFLARPWKCGGSFVVTVPSSCVTVYGLSKLLTDKVKVCAVMAVANDSNLG